MGTEGALSLGVEHGQGMMLTTHHLLVPRLRKSRSYTSSTPNAPLWSIMGPLYLFFYQTILHNKPEDILLQNDILSQKRIQRITFLSWFLNVKPSPMIFN
jgi:hypothetical protein